ncbi:MAG: F0F1 ATP synthase subunit A [bacterium]
MHEGIAIHLAPLALFHIGSFAVTNTLFTTLLVSLLLIVFAYFAGRSLKLKPGKFQAVLELIIVFPYTFVRDTLEDEKAAEKLFPIVMTIFLLVLTVNWFGLLPIGEGIGFGGEHGFVPLFHASSTDLNFTLALALVAFFTIEIFGIAALGAFKYGKKFITFASPIAFVVGLIELVSEVARLISFSFRLFGNVFAGKVLILVLASFVPLLLPVPFLAFELFVGFIQAAIFALLTLFFTKIAISGHAEHEHADGHDGAEHGLAHAVVDERDLPHGITKTTITT